MYSPKAKTPVSPAQYEVIENEKGAYFAARYFRKVETPKTD